MELQMSINIEKEVYLKNLTYKYIRPCLAYFGKDFIAWFNGLRRVGYAIGDELVEGSPKFSDNNTLFIIFDSSVNTLKFSMFLDYLQDKEYFLGNYVRSTDLNDLTYQVLVFKFPESFNNIFTEFKKGKFSKMFTKEEIDKFFPESKYPEQRKILLKDETLRESYIEKVNREFEVNICSFKDFKYPEKIEFEDPFSKSREYF